MPCFSRFAVVAAIATAIAVVVYLILPALERTGRWAYLVGFLIQGATASTVVIPVPGLAALTVMSLELNPYALAAAGAAGGSLGELTGYWLGTQGRGLMGKTRFLRWVRPQMARRGALVIVLFAAIPMLPMDAAGIVAGSSRYSIARFLMATFVGKYVLLLVTFFIARGTLRIFS
jgi:membrane protein YqaA with SNARE-associated domain